MSLVFMQKVLLISASTIASRWKLGDLTLFGLLSSVSSNRHPVSHTELVDKGQPTFGLGKPYVPAGHVSGTARIKNENDNIFDKPSTVLMISFTRWDGKNCARGCVDAWTRARGSRVRACVRGVCNLSPGGLSAGVLPIVDHTGRFRPKRVTFSGWILEVYKRVGIIRVAV